jgi:hypothetical protein
MHPQPLAVISLSIAPQKNRSLSSGNVDVDHPSEGGSRAARGR